MSQNELRAPTSGKVFIKTYGCQMNAYDSERMLDGLTAKSFTPTEHAGDADLIVLNTCHIREKAAEKVYSELGRLRRLKEAHARGGKSMQIVVAGCVAQAEGAEILARAPVVDAVVGPQSYHDLPGLLRRAAQGPVVATDFAVVEKFAALRNAAISPAAPRRVTAFLTVQEGCDKFCSFCVVPYTRGAEVSRAASEILAEARRLAANGVREVTLLGQNVNGWRGVGLNRREWGLGRLLFALAEVPGLRRLRYTTSHPRDMDDALIAAHRDLDVLMPYLHLPVQSGSNRILKAMNRRHDRDAYLRLIDRIRAARPDMAFSGDFIVGFPGESEADFQDTLRIVDEVSYASAFSFKYSPRPGTPAADRDAQIAEATKADRLRRLQAVINAAQIRFNAGMVGRTLEVLLEKPGRRPGQLAGRSPYLQAVHVDAPPTRIGDLVEVEIVASGPHSLTGRLTAETRPMAEEFDS